MNKRVLNLAVTAWCGFASCAVIAQQTETDSISGNVAFTSDYVFRGISKSGGDTAMTGELRYASPIGLFAALQGATIDGWVPGIGDAGELELQYTLGYRNRWHADWSWSTGFVYYDYPAADGGNDFDYGEFLLSASYRDWLTGSVAYSNDVLASDEDGVTYQLDIDYPLAGGFSVLAGLGFTDLGDFYGTDYRFGSLGLKKSWKNLDFSILYRDAENDAEDVFGALAEGDFLIQVRTGF